MLKRFAQKIFENFIFFFSMFGEFVYNCIKLKVWAEASVTLVFFYSILKNGTSESDAVA